MLLLLLNLELFKSLEVKKTLVVFGRGERWFDRRTLIITWVYIRGKTINMGEHAGDSVEYGIVRRLVVGSYPSIMVRGPRSACGLGG